MLELFSVFLRSSFLANRTSDLYVESQLTTIQPICMNKIPPKLQPWFDARRRFKLSDAEIQMARELGMNPKKLGSLATEKQQSWKLPLREFIAECYFKRFKRERPEQVRTLEQVTDADDVRRKLLDCPPGTKT
jgi:hypothetical protein